MRDLSYSKIKPQFWTGTTGKQIRAEGMEARVIALYLITSPHANMIGLYHLPVAYIAADAGISPEEASKALQSLGGIGFCRYDEAAEVVWVCEMARYQVGERLNANDKQCKGVNNCYLAVPNNRFLADFFDKYAEHFHLKERRPSVSTESPSKGLPSPSAGPMEVRRSQYQEQYQQQQQKQEKPSHKRGEADPRHSLFKNLIDRYWKARNPEFALPWDGAEARQLSLFLSANPKVDETRFLSLLQNRNASDVNHSERPRKWLPRLTDYARGPLNQFGKPKGSEVKSNGKGTAALRALRECLGADPDGIGQTGDFQTGDRGHGDTFVLLEAVVRGER